MHYRIGSLLACLLLSSPAMAQEAITFTVAPGATATLGDPASLRAHWNRDKPPGWRILFQHRKGNEWFTLNATDGLGNELPGPDGKPYMYACETVDCRLAVNPAGQTPVTMEFRLVVMDMTTGKRQDGTHILPVTWNSPVAESSDLVLRIATAGATCELKWRLGETTVSRYCRSTIDGPAAPDSAQMHVNPDGSAAATEAVASWSGFQKLQWRWLVRLSFGTEQGAGSNLCADTEESCKVTIPPRAAGTGESVGRGNVSASIGWDAKSGPGNPNGPLRLDGLTIEQGIDYRK